MEAATRPEPGQQGGGVQCSSQKQPLPQEDGAACFKCGGSGQAAYKRKRTDQEGGRFEHGFKTCGVCKGQGFVLAARKIKAKAAMTEKGIISPCYRPPGYEVPGPKPRPLGTVMPQPGEALCCLTGDWRIFQPIGGHRYSTDDVVTAWAAVKEVQTRLAKTEDDGGLSEAYRGLDMGCGLGSVLLMMCWNFPKSRYVGVEAQEASVERARRSAYSNACDDRVQVVHGDLREIETVLPEGKGAFDVITGTPPYFDVYGVQDGQDPTAPQYTATKKIGGKKRQLPVPLPAATDQRPCNFEYRGGVEAYCRAASHCLSPHPRSVFVMCSSDGPGVHDRVMAAAQAANLQVLRKLEVIPRVGRPSLFAVWTMAHPTGSLPGSTVETRRLIVRQADGSRTEEYVALMDDMGMPQRPPPPDKGQEGKEEQEQAPAEAGSSQPLDT